MKTLKEIYLITFFLFVFNNLAISQEANFNDIFIFGDSLNDSSHKGKAVSGGDYYPAQGEILSQKLINKALLDFKEGGNNYSTSGFQIWNIIHRYNRSFDKSKIGENNLFYLPIGNNDAVITNVLLHPTPALEIIHHSANKVIEKRSEAWKNIAIELGNNGKNTILTTTLFDMSLTPLPLFLTALPRYDIISYLDVLLLNGGLHYKLNNFIASLYNFSNKPVISDILWNLGIFPDSKWKEFINNHPKPQGMSGETYLHYLSREIYQQTIGGKVLSIIMYPIMDYLKLLMHDYTHQYSDTIQKKLASTNENIIFIDFENALHEIYDNPQNFGFDNIISPQCSIGLAALNTGICKKNSDFLSEDKNYLFGDLVHPSGYAHQVAADYIMSVINAPIFFTSIAKHLSNNNFTINEYLKDQLTIFRINPLDEKYNLLFAYSGYSSKGVQQNGVIRKNNFYNNLNLGLLYNINDKNIIGSLLSLGFGKIKPYENFRYDSNNQKISLFYQLKTDFNIWTNFGFGYSRLSANDITRKIITTGSIFEKGNTHSHANNFNINIGYDFTTNNKTNFIISPYIGYSYNRYKINGYQEFNKHSTSMNFNNININENYSTIGLQFNNKKPYLDIMFDISYSKNFSDKEIDVFSGLKNAPRNYKRIVKFSNNYWGNIKLGINKNFNKNISINTNIGCKINPSKTSNDLNLNLGINYKF